MPVVYWPILYSLSSSLKPQEFPALDLNMPKDRMCIYILQCCETWILEFFQAVFQEYEIQPKNIKFFTRKTSISNK